MKKIGIHASYMVQKFANGVDIFNENGHIMYLDI